MSIILDANAPETTTSHNQATDLIKDSRVETFVQDVIVPSMKMPTVDAICAARCGHC